MQPFQGVNSLTERNSIKQTVTVVKPWCRIGIDKFMRTSQVHSETSCILLFMYIWWYIAVRVLVISGKDEVKCETQGLSYTTATDLERWDYKPQDFAFHVLLIYIICCVLSNKCSHC